MYFYGSFLGTRQSAIGQSFPLSLETVSEVFAEVTSVLDNMRPPLIKTFFFFCDVNQTVTAVASTVFVK